MIITRFVDDDEDELAACRLALRGTIHITHRCVFGQFWYVHAEHDHFLRLGSVGADDLFVVVVVVVVGIDMISSGSLNDGGGGGGCCTVHGELHKLRFNGEFFGLFVLLLCCC